MAGIQAEIAEPTPRNEPTARKQDPQDSFLFCKTSATPFAPFRAADIP